MYRPEKRFFTEQDFEQMDWQDSAVHGMFFGPGPDELTLDIDYIFKWEQPLVEKSHRTFQVSPATLIFEGVSDLRIRYKGDAQVTIVAISRQDLNRDQARSPRKLWRWKIVCLEGDWEFCASGYRQFIRRPPELLAHPRLAHKERGGFDLKCPNR